MNEPQATRLDKWLWHARFVRTRTLAAGLCGSGRIRVNGQRVSKAHYCVRTGDVLTFPLGERIRIVRIVAVRDRRGSAGEARALFEDLGDD